jgi:hypothetical protein
MKLSDWRNTRLRLALVYVLVICSFQLYPLVSYAQNLGTQPATGQAVQGQTAAQLEGTVLNLVNWVGNVMQRKLSRFSERNYSRETVREVGLRETKDGSARSVRVMPLTMRPGVSRQSGADEPARQPALGEEHCLSVPEPYSRNDWRASSSFHTAPPCGGSTPVPQESLSHPEGHKPRLEWPPITRRSPAARMLGF